MKQYVCITTFISHSGHQYCKGDKIYENEYHNLTREDKGNFSEVKSDLEEFEAPSTKNPRFNHDEDQTLRTRNMLQDDDWSTQQASRDIDEIYGGNTDAPDDFDFGGGDSGGAGASGDWND